MKILILYDGSGPKYHRLFLPCVLMPGIEIAINNRLVEEQLQECDILFVNRAIGVFKDAKVEDAINDLKRTYRFKLIVDFDDHWELGPDHLLYEDYVRGGKTEVMKDYLRLADVVTVTHERLASDVYEFNKNVHILPNAIPNWGQFQVEKIPDPLVRIFWAGSATHNKDFDLLRRPLKLIKRDRVKLVMAGYQRSHSVWHEMAKCFTTDSSYNTQVIESLPVEQYYASYRLCDIAIIPLLDNKFNSYKSNLKVLEAANVAAPVVVSRVHPYLDFPEDLVNYVDSHNTWYSQIKHLIDNPDEAKEQGLQLQEYCNEYFNFDKINKHRKQIFDECLQLTSKSLKDYGISIPQEVEPQAK